MIKLLTAVPMDDYKIKVSFDDGVNGVLDMRPRLFGPIFEALKDPALFKQATVDEFGALCWPNGADQAPDALHDQLQNQVKAA